MDIPRICITRDDDVISLPGSVPTLSMSHLTCDTCLDTISVHSDDVTPSRESHVSRKKWGFLKKATRMLLDKLQKSSSLDNLSESVAINHADPTTLLNRCASCYNIRSSRDGRARIAMLSRKQAQLIEDDVLFEFGCKNFSSQLSPVLLCEGQVRTELCLDVVSYLPLLLETRDNQLVMYVDKSQNYCSRCNRTRRVSVPYRVGSLDLPLYMDTRTLNLTYTTDSNTLTIEARTKGGLVNTKHHVTLRCL